MADALEVTQIEKVKVKTTRAAAYIPTTARAPYQTSRLVLRSLTADDLPSYHHLRSQPEVMIYTMQGRPDKDIAESQTKLDHFISPGGDSVYVLGVFERETGQFVGSVGSHMRVDLLGWPCLGYMLCTEAWGKGYATEMVRGFLDVYWSLPREEVLVELDVDTSTAPAAAAQGADGVATVAEKITAITLDSNVASQNVLLKAGFKQVKKWIDSENEPLLPLCYAFALEKPQ